MRLIDADKLKAKVRAQEWKRDPTIMLALNLGRQPDSKISLVRRCYICRIRGRNG